MVIYIRIDYVYMEVCMCRACVCVPRQSLNRSELSITINNQNTVTVWHLDKEQYYFTKYNESSAQIIYKCRAWLFCDSLFIWHKCPFNVHSQHCWCLFRSIPCPFENLDRTLIYRCGDHRLTWKFLPTETLKECHKYGGVDLTDVTNSCGDVKL